MSENINLMPQEAVRTKEKKSYSKTVNIAAIVALLIVAAILLGLFGYQVFLSATSSRIDTQTRQAEEETLAQSSKEITRRTLVDKLDTARAFLAKRLKYSTGYKAILDIIGNSATLTEGTVNNDGIVTITGETSSLTSLRKVVDALNKVEALGQASSIDLVSLTKEIDQPYKFTIDYDFLDRGLLPEATTEGQDNE